MMKILTTSDWHLGNCFHWFDRLPEHAHFFDWLLDLVKQEQLDVLLVAGDIFDSSNPSAASQELYYSFLDRLTKYFPKLATVIIAGNHDSAARLEAPRVLLERHKIFVRGVIQRLPDGSIDFDNLLIPVVSAENPASRTWIVAVPFLREGDFMRGLSYADGVADFLNRALECVARHKSFGDGVVLMAHLYATGTEIADGSSERIVVGGAEMVDIGKMLPEVACVVLGHLHRKQQVGGKKCWFYPGSALPMSFTERNYQHGAVCFQIEGEKISEPYFHEYTLLHPLRTIPDKPASLPEVLKLLKDLPDGTDIKGETQSIPYLEVNVLLDAPVPGVSKLVEDALDGKQVRLCRTTTTYRVQLEGSGEMALESVDDLLTCNPIEVIRKSYLNKHKCEMRDELVSLAMQAIEAARKEEDA